jgi:hypothetical protein
MARTREFWVSLWRKEGAKPECPFCGHDGWIGWNDRVRVEQLFEAGTLPEGVEVIPLTCSKCGFVRLQSTLPQQEEIL